MISQDYLMSILEYDEKTGMFTWASKRPKIKIGSIAGGIDSQGYCRINIDGKKYAAHRLAFLYMQGIVPPNEVDHINGVRIDNRWVNLRLADKSQNLHNQGIRKTNTTGCKGVHFQKSNGRFVSYIRANGKRIYLGLSDNIFEAAAKSISAINSMHGQFGRIS